MKNAEAEEKLRQAFDMWNRIDDCVEIVKQLHGIYYPPSGKYYEFKDGTTCEDWDLEPTIRRKLVEIDHVKKENKMKVGKQYVRQQKGHSLVLHLMLTCVGIGIITIPYYTLSPNHYWHI